jgi:hypothetical protein
MLASGPAAPSDPPRRPAQPAARDVLERGHLGAVRARGRLGSLRPEQANQFGRFYPAVAGLPALVDLPWDGTWPKRVSDEAGIPETWWWAGGVGAALIAVGALLGVRRKAAYR